jgi:hypothetical protein
MLNHPGRVAQLIASLRRSHRKTLSAECKWRVRFRLIVARIRIESVSHLTDHSHQDRISEPSDGSLSTHPDNENSPSRMRIARPSAKRAAASSP